MRLRNTTAPLESPSPSQVATQQLWKKFQRLSGRKVQRLLRELAMWPALLLLQKSSLRGSASATVQQRWIW